MLGWRSVRQVFRITRERTLRDRATGVKTKTTEVVYGITSLTRDQANAQRLLEYNRGHWGIENRLHDTRDVTFGEDASRVRTNHGPRQLATARNAAIAVCRAQNRGNLAVARRDFAWDSQLIRDILGYVMN